MTASESVGTDLVPQLRAEGFSGSGATYRKLENEVLFVVNFQRSRDGSRFFINLGGQPTCIPDEGRDYPNPRTLKEYECVFRERVGTDWSRLPTPSERVTVRAELQIALARFRETVLSVPRRVRMEAAEELLHSLPFGCTAPRAALHLARWSKAHGDPLKTQSFVELGMRLAGTGATILVAELQSVRSEVS
jgi:hypothetical protein